MKRGLRKIIATLVVFIVASVFCWFGKITGSEWVTCICICLALFIGGNVASKAIFWRNFITTNAIGINDDEEVNDEQKRIGYK